MTAHLHNVLVTVDDPLLAARARVLRDLEATGAASPASVSALEAAVIDRRWWVSQWESGERFAAGLVAQDVQDALLEDVGRWPLCPLCDHATHALYIHPESGGPCSAISAGDGVYGNKGAAP